MACRPADSPPYTVPRSQMRVNRSAHDHHPSTDDATTSAEYRRRTTTRAIKLSKPLGPEPRPSGAHGGRTPAARLLC